MLDETKIVTSNLVLLLLLKEVKVIQIEIKKCSWKVMSESL